VPPDSLEDIYRRRRSTRWQDRLRRLLAPPAPLVMNPAEPKDFPLGRWNLYLGGAGSRPAGSRALTKTRASNCRRLDHGQADEKSVWPRHISQNAALPQRQR